MLFYKPKPISIVHPASLVDRSQHSPALLELLDTTVSYNIIDYGASCVIDTVQTALGHPVAPPYEDFGRTRLVDFMTRVVYKAEIKISVLLVTLVYIERAKHFLHISTNQWANERVFLGALMTAYKYVNDASLKNYHWSVCTGCFGIGDVGRVEREFLAVLDYCLSFTEDDIFEHHEIIMRITYPHRYYKSSSIPIQHRTIRTRSPSVSCFSDDSSDMSIDSDSDHEYDLCRSLSTSSSSSPSLPLTPEDDPEVIQPSSHKISIPVVQTTNHTLNLNLLYSFPTPPSSGHSYPPRAQIYRPRVC
ncbi:hypothetical protein ABKN59_004604 [Abortiporus biennis]